MIRSRKMDIVCILAAVTAAVITVLLIAGCLLWGKPDDRPKSVFTYSDDYAKLIFDDSYVHEIDIVIPQVNWDYMVEHATKEQYVICNAVVDGEEIKNVAIRPKGNSSLSAIKAQGSDRFSFKIEFDHYDKSTNYHGLDKLALNNLGQDVSCMKDYLCYHMMNEAGAAAPLSSYVQLKLNGEDFGLYLAVEAIEESFAHRNWGDEFGNIYKPECFEINNVTPKAFINQDEDIFKTDYTHMGRGDRADILGTMVRVPFESCFGENMKAAAFNYLGEDKDRYKVFFDSSVFDITEKEKDTFIDAVRRLNSPDEAHSAIDAESLINYFVVHTFVNNYDSYNGIFVHNYYIRENDGRLAFIPWDYNLAFGIFTFGTAAKSIIGDSTAYEVDLDLGDAMDDVTNMVNYPIDTPTFTVSNEDRPLLNVILSDDEYLELYHKRYREFLDDYIYSGRFEESYSHTLEIISPYLEKGQTFYTRENAEKGAQAVHDYCMLRAQSVMGQLEGTIPSTAKGQSEDYENLIDASHVDLAASVTFDSLIFGIQNEDIIDLLDAIAGDRPHNSQGVGEAINEVIEDSGKLPEMIMRIAFSSRLIKNAMISAVMKPALLIISFIALLTVRKKIIKHSRRRKGGGVNAVSS